MYTSRRPDFIISQKDLSTVTELCREKKECRAIVMLQLKGYTKVITQESCEIKFSGHTKQTLNRVALNYCTLQPT